MRRSPSEGDAVAHVTWAAITAGLTTTTYIGRRYAVGSQWAGAPLLPLMYWGKYVQHDNNRDGMGQYLKITQNFTRAILEWHPTVLHDLHEAQSYLYV